MTPPSQCLLPSYQAIIDVLSFAQHVFEIHVYSSVSGSFFIIELYSIVWTYHNMLYLFICWWTFEFSQYLATMNIATLNIVYSFGRRHMFSFLLSKYQDVKWPCHMVSVCLICKKLSYSSLKDFYVLHSYQQCMRVTAVFHSCQPLLFSTVIIQYVSVPVGL